MYKYILLLLLPITVTFAQNPEAEQANKEKAKIQNGWNLGFWELGRPTIEFSINKNDSYYNEKAFPYDIAGNTAYLAKIGFSRYAETSPGSNILKYSYPSIFYSISDGDPMDTTSGGLLNSQVYTLGLLASNGYGYKISGDFCILLTHGTGVSWNSIDFTNPNGIIAEDNVGTLETMSDGVRFGELFETGIKLRLLDNIGVYMAYSENLIMPRHLFWYWAMGSTIEGVVQELATYFVNSAIATSPELVPILYFVIKNGLSYGYHRLRENNMNWPFNTAAPMFEKSFNVGVSFIF
jgi:hypothetical protein